MLTSVSFVEVHQVKMAVSRVPAWLKGPWLTKRSQALPAAEEPVFVPGTAMSSAAAEAAVAEMMTAAAQRAHTLPNLPLEILQLIMLYLPANDVRYHARVSRSFRLAIKDASMWQALLDRDFSESATDRAVAKHPEHRLEDVHQMLTTNQYVEKRFEDRTTSQKVGIVLGTIAMLPLLIVWLLPKIVKGVYRNGILPAMDTWSTEWSAADASYASVARADPRRVTFSRRPWYQKLSVLIVSFVALPFWAVRYPRRLVAFVKYGCKRLRGSRMVKGCVARYRHTASFLSSRVVQPLMLSLAAKQRQWAINSYRRRVRIRAKLFMLQRWWTNHVVAPTVATVCQLRDDTIRKKNLFVAAVVSAKDSVVSTVHTAAQRVHEFVQQTWNAAKNNIVIPAQRAVISAARFGRLKAVESATWLQHNVWLPLVSWSTMICRDIVVPLARQIIACATRRGAELRHLFVSTVESACAFSKDVIYENYLRPAAIAAWNGATEVAIGCGDAGVRWYHGYVVVAARSGWNALGAAAAWTYHRALVPSVVAVKNWGVACGRALRRLESACSAWLWGALLAPVARSMRAAWLGCVRCVAYCLARTHSGIIALIAAGRRVGTVCTLFVWHKALVPCGRAIRSAVLAVVGAAAYVTRRLIDGVVFAASRFKRLVTVCAQWLMATVLRPLGRTVRTCVLAVVFGVAVCGVCVVRVSKWCATKLRSAFVACSQWLWKGVLCPTGRALKSASMATYDATTKIATWVKLSVWPPIKASFCAMRDVAIGTARAAVAAVVDVVRNTAATAQRGYRSAVRLCVASWHSDAVQSAVAFVRRSLVASKQFATATGTYLWFQMRFITATVMSEGRRAILRGNAAMREWMRMAASQCRMWWLAILEVSTSLIGRSSSPSTKGR